MKILLSADIHLSRRPDHAYRWQAMKQLAKHAARDDVAAVVIAGDLVDVKDRHPASFVQQVVASVKEIAAVGKRVFIMKGNHDYIESTCPFFEFLQEIENVVYVTEPGAYWIDAESVLLIPHVKSWSSGSDWRRKFKLVANWNVIICHQTFGGAKASNGFQLDGVPLATVSKKNTGGVRVLAGDIHVPQKIGNVTYIGSPHPVNFGDTFEPGFVLWDLEKEKVTRIKRTTIRRLVLDYEWDEHMSMIPRDLDLIPREGDHVKFRYHGPREDAADWPELRRRYLQEAEKIGFRVFSSEFIVTREKKMPTSSREVFDDDVETPESDDEEFELFCRESKVPTAYLDTGRELLGKSSEREWCSRETEFRSISFQGFRSFRDEEVMKLPKTPGVFLITGENQVEPELGANGVGKSSFADGLCWGLFGKTSKGHRAKDIGNWTGDYLTAVSINFYDECGDNTITRRWNPNALVHQLEDYDPKTIEQHDVERILGLNYKLFLATVLFSQSGKSFMELGPSGQAEALSDVLNLSVWEDRSNGAKIATKVHRGQWEELDQSVKELRAKRGALVDEYNYSVVKEGLWKDEQKKSRKALLLLLDEADVLQVEAHASMEEADRLSRKIGKETDKHKIRVDRYREQIQRVDNQINDLRVQEAQQQTLMHGVQSEVRRYSDLLNAKTGRCPYCDNQLQKDVIEKELRSLKRREQDRENKLYDTEEELVEAKKNKDCVHALKLEAIDDRILARNDKTEAANHYQDCVDTYQRAEKAIVIIQTQIKSLKKEKNPHAETLDELDRKIDFLAHEIKHGAAEARRREVWADRANYWSQGFLRIRLWLLERAMCEFEAKMLNSFDMLGLKGWNVSCNTEKTLKTGGTKPALTILVSSPESPEPVPWGVWSGGEEQRLKVAGSAAFSDLVCDRMGVRPSMEIWDEPTQHLSGEGCDDLMEFFGHRARMLKKQIWVIDHRTTASGEVDGHWHFTKNEYGTHIKELR